MPSSSSSSSSSSSPVAADKLLYYVIWQRISLFLDDISLLRLGGTATILREIVNTDDVWTNRHPNLDYGTSQNYTSGPTLSFFEILMASDPNSEARRKKQAYHEHVLPLTKNITVPIFTFRDNTHFAALLTQAAVGMRDGNKFLDLIKGGKAAPQGLEFVRQVIESASSFQRRSVFINIISAQNEITAALKDTSRSLVEESMAMTPDLVSARLRLRILYYVLQKRAETSMFIESVRGTFVAPVLSVSGASSYVIGFGILKLFSNYVFPSWSLFSFYNQVCEVSGYPYGAPHGNFMNTNNHSNTASSFVPTPHYSTSSFLSLFSWPLSFQDYYIFDRQNPLPYVISSYILQVIVTHMRMWPRGDSASEHFTTKVKLFRGTLQFVGEVIATCVVQLELFCRCQAYSAFVAAPILKTYNYFFSKYNNNSSSSPTPLDMQQVCHLGFWISALFPYVKYVMRTSRVLSLLSTLPASLVTMYLGNIATYSVISIVKNEQVVNHQASGFPSSSMNPILLYAGLILARAVIRPMLYLVTGNIN